jgi:hypothetical protein
MTVRALLAFSALWGCAQGAQPTPGPNFTLACESLDAPTESTLQCVRTDTRNGDVRLIDLDKVPITSGTSRALEEGAGTYQVVCDATTTSQRSDLWCVRIHALNGEVVLLKLGELPRWPSP